MREHVEALLRSGGGPRDREVVVDVDTAVGLAPGDQAAEGPWSR